MLKVRLTEPGSIDEETKEFTPPEDLNALALNYHDLAHLIIGGRLDVDVADLLGFPKPGKLTLFVAGMTDHDILRDLSERNAQKLEGTDGPQED